MWDMSVTETEINYTNDPEDHERRGPNIQTLDLLSIPRSTVEALAASSSPFETFHIGDPAGAQGASPGFKDRLRKTCHSSACFPIRSLCTLYRSLALITSPFVVMITSSETPHSAYPPSICSGLSNLTYAGGWYDGGGAISNGEEDDRDEEVDVDDRAESLR